MFLLYNKPTTKACVLTEDVEYQGGLSLTNIVLSSAVDDSAVVIWRQACQDEGALLIQVIQL